jgi:hypothetical protein
LEWFLDLLREYMLRLRSYTDLIEAIKDVKMRYDIDTHVCLVRDGEIGMRVLCSTTVPSCSVLIFHRYPGDIRDRDLFYFEINSSTNLTIWMNKNYNDLIETLSRYKNLVEKCAHEVEEKMKNVKEAEKVFSALLAMLRLLV